MIYLYIYIFIETYLSFLESDEATKEEMNGYHAELQRLNHLVNQFEKKKISINSQIQRCKTRINERQKKKTSLPLELDKINEYVSILRDCIIKIKNEESTTMALQQQQIQLKSRLVDMKEKVDNLSNEKAVVIERFKKTHTMTRPQLELELMNKEKDLNLQIAVKNDLNEMIEELLKELEQLEN